METQNISTLLAVASRITTQQSHKISQGKKYPLFHVVSEFFSDLSLCPVTQSLGTGDSHFRSVYCHHNMLSGPPSVQLVECEGIHIEWVNMEYISIYLESVSENIRTLLHSTNSWIIKPNTFCLDPGQLDLVSSIQSLLLVHQPCSSSGHRLRVLGPEYQLELRIFKVVVLSCARASIG